MFRLPKGNYLKAVAASGFLTGGGASTFIYNDEGAQRTVQFWYNIFPLYVTYRSVQFLNRDIGVLSDDKALEIYESYHEKFSGPVKDVVYRMRGFYLKQAQLLSTQDDFVPAAYMRWVKDTQVHLNVTERNICFLSMIYRNSCFLCIPFFCMPSVTFPPFKLCLPLLLLLSFCCSYSSLIFYLFYLHFFSSLTCTGQCPITIHWIRSQRICSPDD